MSQNRVMQMVDFPFSEELRRGKCVEKYVVVRLGGEEEVGTVIMM